MSDIAAVDAVNADVTRGESESATFYISIGNSDSKLDNIEWSDFIHEIKNLANEFAACGECVPTVHEFWHSIPGERWVNACLCIEFKWRKGFDLRSLLIHSLSDLALVYRQDSISLGEATTTFVLYAKRAE